MMVGADPVDGWYPVEKQKVAPSAREEDDPSIWVLFAKKEGGERFQVRFPVAPTYHYAENGDLEVVGERGGQSFRLTVSRGGEAKEDLHYPAEEGWMHEHFVKTGAHLYHFQLLGSQADAPHFREFITSFSIEEN